MKVKISGIGLVDFPDSMNEEEVKAALMQHFGPKKDDTVEKLLQSIEKLLKAQKPVVLTESKPYPVEKQIVVTEPKIVEVPVREKQELVCWYFDIERDENDMITRVTAEPDNG